MPEVPQYLFTHKELVTLLVKAAGVHEGKWSLAVQVGFATGHFGATPDQMGPGVVVGFQRIGIQRVIEGGLPQPPDVITVDAAEVNPVPPNAPERPT